MKSLLVNFALLIVTPLTSFADLYVNDHETRTVMTAEEQHLPLVSLMRGSAVLLGPDLILTAEHVIHRWESYAFQGKTVFIRPGASAYYFKFVSVLERNEQLDYAIIRIRWQDDQQPPGLTWVKSIVMPEEVPLDVPQKTALFALGVPWDKIPNGMKSSGDAFMILANPEVKYPLLFNAGVMEGNSGGPIFVDQNKLLGIVTGGPHSMGEDGMEGNDPSKPASWNWGTPIQNIYQASPVLQELF